MGSLCNSPTTTTQQYTPNAQASGVYSNILNQAQQVASTPYQAYNGELTAPVNSEQLAGIGNVNAAANQAQPYINTAAGYAATGAAPVASVGAGDINQYMSPYNQNVINATQNQFNQSNAQQQSAVLGNAASQGALGGDRSAVAQALTTQAQQSQQAPVIAGLYNQNYSQALGEANTQQQNAQLNAQRSANAGNQFANLGATAESSALQGAGAQLTAGGVQQSTQQAQDTASYQQYLNQLAYPYQNLAFESSIAAPIGGAMGGTQTTTPPSPNPFSQYLGLGITAAAALKRGGRVGYAAGGATPYNFIASAQGYVPTVSGIQAAPQHQFSSPTAANPNALPSAASLKSGITNLKGLYSNLGSPLSLGSGFSPVLPGWQLGPRHDRRDRAWRLRRPVLTRRLG